MFVSRERTNETTKSAALYSVFQLIVLVLYYTTSLSVRRSILSKKICDKFPETFGRQTTSLATIDFI